MGLFNYVNFEMNCPGCGSLLRDFQTKDGHCCLDMVEIEAVTEFYALCGKCNHWTEFARIPPSPEPRERKERATREQAEALGFRLVEREERYCEIAARRMAQEVLPLHEHDNAELTGPQGR